MGEFASSGCIPLKVPGGTAKGTSKPNFAVPFSGPAVLYLRKA